MRSGFKVAVAAIFLAAGAASAVPSFVYTGITPSDISSDGGFVAGTFYDAARNLYPVMRYTVGGTAFDTGGANVSGVVRCSDDGMAISYTGYNFENLNNASNTIVYNSTIANMWERTSIAHFWSAAGGNVNLGCASNGNNCDFTINTAYDISGNGRYVIASGWSARLCGPYKCWRIDTQGSGFAAWSQLPASFSGPPANAFATAVRGNAINGDGSVIGGYDQNYDSTQSYVLRRPAVWVRSGSTWTQTVLDPDGGEVFGVSANGLVAVGHDHLNQATRWVRTGNTWGAGQNLGAGTQNTWEVSADGSTVLGDSFIWRANLNGGVAVDLTAYLLSQGLDLAANNIALTTFGPSAIKCLSGDGNAIGVVMSDYNDPCLLAGGGGVIYLTGHSCVAPASITDPKSDSTVSVDGRYTYGVILNSAMAGSWPMTRQWQKWDSTLGAWADVVDDVPCDVAYGGQRFDVKGSHGPQLRVGFQKEVLFGDLSWRGRYRCVATNSCGTATSKFAVINSCKADFNCDGSVDFFDYLDFVDAFSSSSEFADFNEDGTIDFFDYLDFVDAFSTGC